jgi:LytS/YehU family sensor histidine kinase
MPRYLEKGKYFTYILFLLGTTIIAALIIASGYYISAALSVKTYHELYYSDPRDYLHFFQINTLPSTMASMTLAMSIKLTSNWIQSRKRLQAMEKEKISTELAFLKLQLNPHFLFNSINSIFVLINKNPAVAADSLARFSDLLRYQLYECNEPKILLSKEVDYLRNFIGLEKLRQEESLTVNFLVGQDVRSDLSIAPFILLTFVENAFKHVSRRKELRNRIDIHLRMEGNNLRFDICNSLSELVTVADVFEYGGIGLKNVKRRLELIYPGEHVLSIDRSAADFRVHLSINLRPLTVSKINQL